MYYGIERNVHHGMSYTALTTFDSVDELIHWLRDTKYINEFCYTDKFGYELNGDIDNEKLKAIDHNNKTYSEVMTTYLTMYAKKIEVNNATNKESE